MNKQIIINGTRQWIASMVIGLNLCPFAQRVFDAGRIRYVVTEAADDAALLNDLVGELQFLAAAPMTAVETTLLIHPHAFANFLDYNDFLGSAEQAVADLGLEGVIQVASFHPDYQFADTGADDVENYTNRSPYPMLHLLREESISAIADDEQRLLEIPRRNIEVLRALGARRFRSVSIQNQGEHPMRKSIYCSRLVACMISLVVLLAWAPSAWAQAKKAPKGDPALLTLDRIFNSGDFNSEKTPALRCAKRDPAM